jgi:D-psicose/D-tagatose/L-ribulose 3-epimerase
MFGNSSPSKIIKDISKTGADGLDLSVTYNDDIQIYTTAQFRTELEEHNLYVGVITPIYKNPHIDLSHSDERVRYAALDFTKKCIDLAELFCCPMLISPSFISPAHSYHTSRKEDWKQAVQSMISVAQYANAKKEKVMIEPINRYMVGLIHTFNEAKNMIEEMGYSNVGVVLDTFHMNMEEPETIEKTLIQAKDYLYCLHLGENNRQPPGNGTLNWPSILKTL